MPIPVINYSAQTPQGSPLGQGLLPAIQQGLNLGYAPHEKKAALERSRLENALSELQLEYAPQQNEQELLRSQQENQFYPQNMESQIGLRNIQAQLLPEQLSLAIEKERRVAERFDTNKKLMSFITGLAPENQSMVMATYPEQMMNLLSDVGNQAVTGGYIPLPGSPSASPDAPTSQLELSGEDIRKLGGSPATGLNNQRQSIPDLGESIARDLPANNSRGRKMFDATPEDIARFAKAAQIGANKRLTTTGTQSQLEGAIQVADVMNNPDFRKKAVNAAEYAGAVGKGKAAVAAFSKDRPESYQDYLSFVNHDMMLLQNRIKALDGMGSSESQMKELHGLYNNTMDLMTSNPKQFIKQLDKLGSALDTVAESVELSANPLGYPSRIKPYKNIGGQESKRSGSTYNRQTGEFE